jgi:hypothetical protein
MLSACFSVDRKHSPFYRDSKPCNPISRSPLDYWNPARRALKTGYRIGEDTLCCRYVIVNVSYCMGVSIYRQNAGVRCSSNVDSFMH